MNTTAIIITAMICATLIILNVIWIFKDRSEKARIQAEIRDEELLLALKYPGPKR
ncbi:hypothetical protein [Lacrimispora amygdalina]|uniref:hypothetical protein n=1 Tax=Lacrimispora amygdalina TaxID=253257 RepID=UPI0014792080|nr:hypothetical protein [Clostridium indicum]